MVSRVSLVLLALASTACFSDSTPGGLSTAGTTSTGVSTTDASTASTTGGPATTTGDATTAAPTSSGATTGTGTSGTTLTTSPGTGTTAAETTDPGTSATTTGPDTGTTTTSAGDFDLCAAADDRFSCYRCCGEATPDWSIYLEGIAGCSCNILQCGVDCNNSLCDGMPITEACFTCIAPMAGGRCFSAVDMKCKAAPGCAPFYDCIETAQCALKPN